MIRSLLTALVFTAPLALGADKPAALQVCVQLPEGVSLFATSPQPHMRALGNGTWMLDFDLSLNGHAVDRITRSGPDCLRAWLPAERLRQLAFDFARLPLNLVNQQQALDVQLKPDLWSDGGRVVIERVAWSTAENRTTGTLTLERSGVVITDWQHLPVGSYLLKFTPAPQPMNDCPIALHVVGIGTVRADHNAATFKELVEYYRTELLPVVLARRKLQCEPAEGAQINVTVVDGVFHKPFAPTITRVRFAEKELQYLFNVDGQSRPFADGTTLQVGPGQALELSEQALQAVR